MVLSKHFQSDYSYFADLLIQDVRSLVSVDKRKVVVPWTTINMIKTTFEELFEKLVDLAISPACTLAMSTNDTRYS